MSFELKDTDHGYRARMKALLKLREPAHVDVGLFESAGTHDRSGASIVEVGSYNEFGTDTIPSRSFIRAWFDEAEAGLRRDFTTLMRSVAEGKRTRAQVLELMGQRMVGQVQARISAGIDPPNEPATVAAKGSSTPLIDTGVLRAAITYRVGGE
jgi:hypothetical protein